MWSGPADPWVAFTHRTAPRRRILSTTKDRNGTEYISTMEAIKYPFFGGCMSMSMRVAGCMQMHP